MIRSLARIHRGGGERCQAAMKDPKAKGARRRRLAESAALVEDEDVQLRLCFQQYLSLASAQTRTTGSEVRGISIRQSTVWLQIGGKIGGERKRTKERKREREGGKVDTVSDGDDRGSG